MLLIHILSITIILLLLFNLGINIYLIIQASNTTIKTSSSPENFCNCFGPQYDGVEADPTHKTYYGGYCYNRDNITKLYNKGEFDKTFPGV
jgi:hypothetical protein